MEKNKLIKTIKNNYDFSCDPSLENLNSINQYPHVLRLESADSNYIIKITEQSRTHCKDINCLYKDLSNIKYIETPILTRLGKYTTNIDDKIILVYKELQQLSENPQADWWAKCLAKLHSMKIDQNYLNYYHKDIYGQVLSLLANAEKYILLNRKQKLYDLINSVNIRMINETTKNVLCHNDPYNLNVLISGNDYKLIDTEGIGLSPKEFDIQKLIYNHVLNTNDIDNALDFWNIFKENYEKEFNSEINVELLKNLYKIDFVRSASWLYLVSNDAHRADIQRQAERLTLFEKSIDSDIHLRVLKRF